MSQLHLEEVTAEGAQFSARYRISGQKFHNTIWYDTVDFSRLRALFGSPVIDRIAFHIAAFEINKLCSLKPDVIDWGPGAGFVTPRFAQLWREIFRNVWAQWRFENDLPDYGGPAFAITAPEAGSHAVSRDLSESRCLAFFAGGKDSLIAIEMLKRIGAAYDTLTYSTSFYGLAGNQHAMITDALPANSTGRAHRQWIYDDFLDSPVLDLSDTGGIRTLTAAETPSSVFESLPIALASGITGIVLAHERSADKGQVRWDESGEDVNHQWGKSHDAERLINRYIQDELLADVSYYSILKPIYDIAIFGALERVGEAVTRTHSCNIRKPWCMSCPKCLYVWLGYAAFLPRDRLVATFGDVNPLADPKAVFTFRQLVGLEDQLPFECIGEAEEAALLMRIVAARGFAGEVLEACGEALARLDIDRMLERYLSVDLSAASIPAEFRDGVERWMMQNAAETRASILRHLGLVSA